MKATIQPRLFTVIAFAFILFTVIGTLTHELGHLAVAQLNGYKGGTIHYGSSNPGTSRDYEIIDSLYSVYETEIKSRTDFPQQELYNATLKRIISTQFWITLGGPLQTMLTGTIGFILLLISVSTTKRDSVSFKQWGFIFLSLFWLRQTTNLVVGMAIHLLNGHASERGDEIRLARHLNWPAYSIEATTGVIGFGILVYIVSKIIPLQQRFTFVSAGMFGGIAGYLIWLQWFGKVIMP